MPDNETGTALTPTSLVPIDILMGSLEKQALERQYLGALAGRESRNLVSRPYNSTKEEAAAVDRIVGSPQTMYVSQGDFVRHAVFELLMLYEREGFVDDYSKDVTAHIKNMRAEAHRLQLRQDFNETLSIYEASLSAGLDMGDWELLHDTLKVLENYVTRTPDDHWKAYLKRTILRSVIVKGTIDALFEHGRDHAEYRGRAEGWQLWLDSLAGAEGE